MYISPERLERVAALKQEAINLGLSGEMIAAHVAAKMGILQASARRYMTQLENAPPERNEPDSPPADPIEVRRHKQRADEAKARLAELEERLVAAEDIRGEVLGLGPLQISRLQPDSKRPAGRRSVILHISDIQYGEVIDYEAMDGVNSYNAQIANQRIGRYFQKAHRFLTELWQGPRAEEVVILLNGDMISGALHHELDRTDDVRPMQAAKAVAEQLAAGIGLICSEGFPIRIICTPGNHGRTTIKPESKAHALQNYDTLVGWFVEMAFKAEPRVSVQYSKSVDALFSVFAFPMLVTHGDRIGSRGGQGFMGATATILRGHTKLVADYAARGINIYKVFTGHFHTPAVTIHGYANNTMAGPSEYSRDGRMGITPAAQDYLVIHEDHGVIEHRVITVGDPAEGSSHAPVLKYRRTA